MKTFCIIISLVFVFTIESFAVIPPGTKKIKIDNQIVYIDKYEITNIDWKEYQKYVERKYGKNSTEYIETFYDEKIWMSVYKDIAAKKYNYMPVVGITLEQIRKYCTWRSEIVNQMNPEGSGKTEIIYTVPTESQYIKILELIGISDVLSEKSTNERIIGLQSGVWELTNENSVLKNDRTFSKDEITPNKKIGFRCIATINKIK